MEALQNRIDSFAKPRRVKNPAKSSSYVNVKWSHPHFIATPETLAEAGFYFNPSFDDRDNVACFMCDKQLSDWEAEDDPFDIHWMKCGDQCSWAIVSFTFTDKSRVPTSKAMERARLDTFLAGDGWIHDEAKNHGANSRKMARAGFVYTPQHSGDDLATCLYCNVALSGWDASDDPLEEHQKRQDGSCPMFESAPQPASKPPSRAPSVKPASKAPPSKQHARSVSSSRHADLVQPTKTHDGDAAESDIAPPSSSRRSGRSVSGTSKSAKTPKVSRNQSRSELIDVKEDDEGIDDDEEVIPKAGRTKSKKSMATATKKARSRSKSVAPRALPDDEADAEVIITKDPARSRSKAKVNEKTSTEDVVEEDRGIDDDEEVILKAGRAKSKKSMATATQKARSKSVALRALPNDEEADAEVIITKGPVRSRSKNEKKFTEKEPEEEPEEEAKILKKSARGRPPARAKEEEDKEDDQGAKVLQKSTRSRPAPRVEDPEDVDVAEEEERRPRAPSKSRAKTPVRKPSRTPAKEVDAPSSGKGRKGSILKVVEISTDEEGGKSEDERQGPNLVQEIREVVAPSLSNVAQERPIQVTSAEVTQENSMPTPASCVPSPPHPPSSLPASQLDPHKDVEVADMEHVAEVLVETQIDEPIEEAAVPQTPPRATAPAPVISTAVAPSTPPALGALLIPALSKLPFMLLENLTDAELDMTVEEWIRYQMEVEYDKFRRDGERELGRFKKRAEEVRGIIEGL